MTDPFQDVDAVGAEFVEIVVGALEGRAAEQGIGRVIDEYLDDLDWPDGGLHVEVGAGSGPIARRMAARAGNGRVVGLDPSRRLIEKAAELAADIGNLELAVGDGAALAFDDASVDNVVMHTVLSHVPDPSVLLAEALRVLVPGGRLVISDADFEKTSLGNDDGDPLDACATYCVRNFVTHPYLAAQVRELAADAGFDVEAFRVASRLITSGDGGLGWLRMGGNMMVERGLIGRALADALIDEYARRRDAGTLYGYQPFFTLIGRKPLRHASA